MMHSRRRLLATLSGAIMLTGLPACAKQEFHLSTTMWIAADQDIAVGILQLPDGRVLHEDTQVPRYDPKYDGWDGSGGPGRGRFKEIPEYLWVSWYLPSPNETAKERCYRRVEESCENASGEYLVDGRKDGELIGPFKVSLKSRIPKEQLALFETSDTPALKLGVTLGLKEPKLRWVMWGRPPGSTLGILKGSDYPKSVELGRGGDW